MGRGRGWWALLPLPTTPIIRNFLLKGDASADELQR